MQLVSWIFGVFNSYAANLATNSEMYEDLEKSQFSDGGVDVMSHTASWEKTQTVKAGPFADWWGSPDLLDTFPLVCQLGISVLKRKATTTVNNCQPPIWWKQARAGF